MPLLFKFILKLQKVQFKSANLSVIFSLLYHTANTCHSKDYLFVPWVWVQAGHLLRQHPLRRRLKPEVVEKGTHNLVIIFPLLNQ